MTDPRTPPTEVARPSRAVFEREIGRAETLRRLGERPDYWAGYERGVRRAYHGEAFGTPEEHAFYLSLVNDPEPPRQQTGRGYRDGLAVR